MSQASHMCVWQGGQEGSARAEEKQVMQTTQNGSHSLTLRMRCTEYQGESLQQPKDAQQTARHPEHVLHVKFYL